MVGLPVEARLLEEVGLRLLESEADRRRHDELLERHHYLHNAHAVGQVLRYVVAYQGEWVAVLTFCSAALHLKPRDRFLQWTARQVCERRYLIAQNSRFLVLPSTLRWPNLASRVLKLVCERLAGDWQAQFGHPVLLVETFVDPNRFRGTCYKASGWEALGQTQGYERCGQDFYLDTQHPKELWVRPLGAKALEQLRAGELAPEFRTPDIGTKSRCVVFRSFDPEKAIRVRGFSQCDALHTQRLLTHSAEKILSISRKPGVCQEVWS